MALLAREAPQAEVVHDQQLRGQVGAERRLEGATPFNPAVRTRSPRSALL